MAHYVCFYCKMEIVRIFEKVESKTENEERVIKRSALHLRLRLSEKAP